MVNSCLMYSKVFFECNYVLNYLRQGMRQLGSKIFIIILMYKFKATFRYTSCSLTLKLNLKIKE